MESPEKNQKGENGMSITLPKFSETEISKTNNTNSNNTISFALTKFDIFDTDSSKISEFMSLSLNAKIEKFKAYPSFRKLKDKNSSNTFLHYICMNDDNFPMMELIKPTIKEMNKQNNFGQTPLHIAIINKNKNITKFLIENGANLNISDNNLNMSLHLAVMNNDSEIIKMLLKYKANPLLVNKNNETVLDIAIKMDFKDCILLLNEVSLMNETKNKRSNNLTDRNNEAINGNNNNKNKSINTFNNIFSHKKIHYKKNININSILSTPKKSNNLITFDKSNSSRKKNIFITSKKPKTRQRTSSTTPINFPFNDKIYTKKIINRSQSTSSTNNVHFYQNQTHKPKKDNDNNNDISIISYKNNIPRKTDFILQNEIFLDNDNDNESIEEEESIIRENIKPKQEETKNIVQNGQIEKKTEKIIESFTSLKTIKVTPITETNNKINPFLQIDSFVSAIHKNDQGISESNGYINEDGLIIVEPSIDITNNNSNNNIIDNKPMQKKEQIINKINNNKKDTKEDLVNFLKRIEMDQYSDLLIKEGFDDINLVINQMKKGNPINDDILREIGIPRPGDRAKILIRIQECAHLFDFKIPFEAVYYINRKKYEFLKYDFHVKALQNWLKKLRLQNYLENFYNNGYYSPELVFIQKATKFPINDTILERDLKIDNINDRKLIMSSISSNSNNYVSELRKKNVKKKNEDNPEYKEQDDNKCMIF
jgi:hypothetical protein